MIKSLIKAIASTTLIIASTHVFADSERMQIFFNSDHSYLCYYQSSIHSGEHLTNYGYTVYTTQKPVKEKCTWSLEEVPSTGIKNIYATYTKSPNRDHNALLLAWDEHDGPVTLYARDQRGASRYQWDIEYTDLQSNEDPEADGPFHLLEAPQGYVTLNLLYHFPGIGEAYSVSFYSLSEGDFDKTELSFIFELDPPMATK